MFYEQYATVLEVQLPPPRAGTNYDGRPPSRHRRERTTHRTVHNNQKPVRRAHTAVLLFIQECVYFTENVRSYLRGGVVGLSGVADEAHNRRNVDDATRALLEHELASRLRAVEDAAQIEVDNLQPERGTEQQAITGGGGGKNIRNTAARVCEKGGGCGAYVKDGGILLDAQQPKHTKRKRERSCSEGQFITVLPQSALAFRCGSGVSGI